MLAVGAVAPVALHRHHGFGDGDRVLGSAEAHHVGGARIGVRLAVGHAHAAADRDVPAGDVAGLVEDGDEAEIVREHVDVVRRRHRDRDLELPRQVGLAVDRLDRFRLAARDLLAVEPDLAIGAGAAASDGRRSRARARRPRACARDWSGLGLHMHVAVDVAAGRDGVEQRGVDRLHGRLEVRLDDAVKLEGLARGRAAACRCRSRARRGRARSHCSGVQHAARDAHADHEGEGLLQLLLACARRRRSRSSCRYMPWNLTSCWSSSAIAPVSVSRRPSAERAAQVVARFLDALVARELQLGFDCPGRSERTCRCAVRGALR